MVRDEDPIVGLGPSRGARTSHLVAFVIASSVLVGCSSADRASGPTSTSAVTSTSAPSATSVVASAFPTTDASTSPDTTDTTEVDTSDPPVLPDDFPSEIALPAGVLLSVSSGGEGPTRVFAVFVQVADANAALRDVVDRLTSVGFTGDPAVDTGAGYLSQQVSNGTWYVLLGATRDRDTHEPVLAYYVSASDPRK